jgi:hypothetical protein
MFNANKLYQWQKIIGILFAKQIQNCFIGFTTLLHFSIDKIQFHFNSAFGRSFSKETNILNKYYYLKYFTKKI